MLTSTIVLSLEAIQSSLVHILNSEQVEYCQVVRQTEDSSEILPGVAYDGKLFLKKASYQKEKATEAIDRARENFLDHKGLVKFLVIKDAINYDIWVEDKAIKLLDQDPASVDLKKLAIDLVDIGGLEIKDRHYNLKNYPRCFVGSEAVEWLSTKLNISTNEAIAIGQKLLEQQWIHHVTNEHQFEDEYLFYRFNEAKLLANDCSEAKLVCSIDLEQIVSDMRNIGGVKIKDRRYNLKNYPRCFVGSEAVEWLSTKLNISTNEAIAIGQKLLKQQLIHHVTNEHQFKNEYLFYRFYWDD